MLLPCLQGEVLVCAKKILLLLLHHLPQKCLFNIFTFGAGECHHHQTHITPHSLQPMTLCFLSVCPRPRTLSTQQGSSFRYGVTKQYIT